MKYIIKNWQNYQHYKDRAPPWIKLHYEMLTSKDWIKFDDASKLLAIVCMMIASRNGGVIDDDLDYIKSVAHLERSPDLKPLINSGFLVGASVVQADASTMQADAIIEERRGEENKRREEVDAGAQSRSINLPENIEVDLWNSFVEMRGFLKNPLTETAKSLAIQKLIGIGDNPNEVLKQSIMNGWKDLYPLKKQALNKRKQKHDKFDKQDYTKGIEGFDTLQ